MDKGQIDGAIISVRCEDVRLHELKKSYASRSRSHRRDRTSSNRNREERKRYPESSYDRYRKSEGQRRSRSASPY